MFGGGRLIAVNGDCEKIDGIAKRMGIQLGLKTLLPYDFSLCCYAAHNFEDIR